MTSQHKQHINFRSHTIPLRERVLTHPLPLELACSLSLCRSPFFSTRPALLSPTHPLTNHILIFALLLLADCFFVTLSRFSATPPPVSCLVREPRSICKESCQLVPRGLNQGVSPRRFQHYRRLSPSQWKPSSCQKGYVYTLILFDLCFCLALVLGVSGALFP